MTACQKFSALEVFNGSDGELTKAFYAELESRGPLGEIAVNLFRAQKSSSRAKVYRGGVRGKGSYKGMAYERKGWALQKLAGSLEVKGRELGFRFGWAKDPNENFNPWVLYVELPNCGQVSFHSPTRRAGPDYTKDWDGQKGASAERIVQFCQIVLDGDSTPNFPAITESPAEEKARLEKRLAQLGSATVKNSVVQAEFSAVCRRLNALKRSAS